MTDEQTDLLQEAKSSVLLLSQNLPTKVDPATISYRAMIPYKAVCFREGLLWRTEELARASCDLYERNDLAAAIILTRATVENAAAAWYLLTLIRQQKVGEVASNLDQRMMQLLMGSRNDEKMPNSIHVAEMLRAADTEVPGVAKNYNILCEYSHPNWSGVSLIYSKIDHENRWTTFGKNPREKSTSANIGLNSLIMTLKLFVCAYEKIGNLLPDFITACEADLEPSKTSD